MSGYAVFLPGTIMPIAVRVVDFERVNDVHHVVSNVKYLSSIIIDDEILIISRNNRFGAIYLGIFNGDENAAMGCIRGIVDAYPDITRMDSLYVSATMPKEESATIIPALRMNYKSIVPQTEDTPLSGETQSSHQRSWEVPKKIIQVLFLVTSFSIVIGLIIATLVIHLIGPQQ